MSENVRMRRIMPRIIGAGLTAALLTGCGSKETDGLVFSIDCPERTELDVIGIDESYSHPTIEVICRGDDGSVALESIEPLVGDAITIDDDGTVRDETLLTVEYEYQDGGIMGTTPRLDRIFLNEPLNQGEISFSGVSITGAEVSEE